LKTIVNFAPQSWAIGQEINEAPKFDRSARRIEIVIENKTNDEGAKNSHFRWENSAYPSQKSHCDGPNVDMTENHPQDTVKPRKADFIRPKYFICYRHIFSIANLKTKSKKMYKKK